METVTPILLPASTLKRNRHTIENDEKTALVKRINRCYARRNCSRKVRIVNGVPILFDTVTNSPRPTVPGNSLQGLAAILDLNNYN